MVYVCIITAKDVKNLEDAVNTFLSGTDSEKKQVVGYTVNSTKGEYSALIQCSGKQNDNGKEEDLDCEAIERESLRTLLLKYNITEQELQGQYGMSRIDVVRRYEFYSDVRGTRLGREIAVADIKEEGLPEAARRQAMTMKEMKDQYVLEWRELAQLFGLSMNKIPYERLSECLRISMDDLFLMDRGLKHKLKRQSQ